jgi:hypothetical protein
MGGLVNGRGGGWSNRWVDGRTWRYTSRIRVSGVSYCTHTDNTDRRRKQYRQHIGPLNA